MDVTGTVFTGCGCCEDGSGGGGGGGGGGGAAGKETEECMTVG